MEKKQCFLSKSDFPLYQLHRGSELRKELFDLIRKAHPDFSEDKYISNRELNEYRKQYLRNLLEKENREISKLQHEVIESISSDKLLSKNVDADEAPMSTGDRISDKVAEVGGSWYFVIGFFVFLFSWMAFNAFLLMKKAFDPYPFILLNLILSCLAAIQAPIIMMSQNRQEDKDRKRAESDYQVNLKAELEIKLLHEKVDHLIQHHTKRLLEIQDLQTEYLNDIIKSLEKKDK